MAELDGVPVGVDELATLALTGYGHFTTVRLDGGRVRGLDLHLDRLVRDCRTVFGAPLDPGRVRDLARRVAGRAPDPTVLRITVFDPDLPLGRPGGPARPRVLVTARPAGPDAPPPVRLRTVRHRRELPSVKHTGLFGALHQRRSAQLAGFDDALFVEPDGRVSEGPTWNIGFLVDGELRWPDADCLPGVTMRLLDRVARRIGLPTRRAQVPVDRIVAGYGAFVSNAAVGLRPVARIDDTDLTVDRDLVAGLRAGYAALPAEPL
ncbi:aminotransferase class IV family protein [Micromonospora zhanjiangensis]|uniref:Aminotransferase class IV family protein n=1 Tax=Micromonospora zhanjiangensis TaxID=1522057 RepID=A0ABV8KIN3_9ACTN